MFRRVVRWLFWPLLCMIIVAPALLIFEGLRYYDTEIRPKAVYTAATPGPGCDTGWGRWTTGMQHTENAQDVPDANTRLLCRQNGLQVTRENNPLVAGDVHFLGTDLWGRDFGSAYRFPNDYRVQVHARMLEGSPNEAVNLHVRWSELYGGYSCEVRANGTWMLLRYDRQGAPEKRLAIGFLRLASRDVTVNVEVHGSQISCALNGMQVAQVSDDTYKSTSSLSFGVADAGAGKVSSQPAALFSAFSYTPLAPRVANRTDVRTSEPRPYMAKSPGFPCDRGTAQWAPPAVMDGQDLTMICQNGALRLGHAKASPQLGIERFYWLDGTFPQNYSVAIQVNVSKLGNGCAGLLARAKPLTDAGGYGFSICRGSVWMFSRYDQQKGRSLAVDAAPAGDNYRLAITLQGTKIRLTLNGMQVVALDDPTFGETGSVALSLFTPSGPGSADFSNFAFLPLPE